MGTDTIFEDKNILVLDKPAGLDMTELPLLPAHRLDKDTSGLILIAKNTQVLENLQNQFKNRQIEKEYIALAFGDVKPETGEIVTEITRDPSRRVPFKAIEIRSGLERGDPRVAKTLWQVNSRIQISNTKCTLLNIKIITGRTHQIRVHMKYLGCPLVGDMVYCTKESKRFSKAVGLERQFLHASKINFKHPITGKKIALKSEMPVELKRIIN